MNHRVPAVSVEIEIHPHRLAVNAIRIRVDRYLDAVGGRSRPLSHGVERVQYYSRHCCLCLCPPCKARMVVRPGIADYFAAAREHGLKRAIVSSSNRAWVDMHLRAAGRGGGLGRDLHRRPRSGPREAVAHALPRGARSARRDRGRGRGLQGLTERRPRGEGRRALLRRDPNEVTRDLGLEEAGADLVLDSLADLPPETLFRRLSWHPGSPYGFLRDCPHRRHGRQAVAALGSRSATTSGSRASG